MMKTINDLNDIDQHVREGVLLFAALDIIAIECRQNNTRKEIIAMLNNWADDKEKYRARVDDMFPKTNER